MVKIRDLYTQESATTEKGKVCLYERGGAFTNTGIARLVGDGEGNRKDAANVRTRGDLACGDHAAIPVDVGDYVIEVDRHRDNVTVSVGIISEINGGTVNIRGAAEYVNRVDGLTDMIDAGIAKSYAYHCRHPYYINN